MTLKLSVIYDYTILSVDETSVSIVFMAFRIKRIMQVI